MVGAAKVGGLHQIRHSSYSYPAKAHLAWFKSLKQIETLRAFGSPDAKLIGNCEEKSAGGWKQSKADSCEVSGVTGIQDIYLKFTGERQTALEFGMLEC